MILLHIVWSRAIKGTAAANIKFHLHHHTFHICVLNRIPDSPFNLPKINKKCHGLASSDFLRDIWHLDKTLFNHFIFFPPYLSYTLKFKWYWCRKGVIAEARIPSTPPRK